MRQHTILQKQKYYNCFQSNEVANSNACELEGMRRMFHLLLDVQNLTLDTLITDRHRQIQKYVRDELLQHPQARNGRHYFDVWHIAKGT